MYILRTKYEQTVNKKRFMSNKYSINALIFALSPPCKSNVPDSLRTLICKAFSYLKKLQKWSIHNQKYHNTILLWHDRGYVYITNHINRERIFWMYSTYRLPSKIQIISTKISPITILSPHRIQLLL